MSDRDNCVFCRIVDFKEEASVVMRTKTSVAFVPLNPVTKGHVLVVPNKHYERFHEIPIICAEEVFGDVILASRGLGTIDYNVIQSNGEAATQTMKHIHFHLVPRRNADGLMLPWTPNNGVDPNLLIWQRQLGWPDVHPEDYCHECGRPNFLWFASREDWNVAVAKLPRGVLEILCPSCFAKHWAEATGKRGTWELSLDEPVTKGQLEAMVDELCAEGDHQLKGSACRCGKNHL